MGDPATTAVLTAAPFLRRHSEALRPVGLSPSDPAPVALDHRSWLHLRRVIIDCIVEEGTKPLGQLLVGLDAIADEAIHPAPFQRLSRTTLVRSGARRWGDLAQKTPDDLGNIRGATDVNVRDIIGICIDVSLEAFEREPRPDGSPRNDSSAKRLHPPTREQDRAPVSPAALSAQTVPTANGLVQRFVDPRSQPEHRAPDPADGRLVPEAVLDQSVTTELAMSTASAPTPAVDQGALFVAEDNGKYGGLRPSHMKRSLSDALPLLRRYCDARGLFAGTPLTEEVADLLSSPGWRHLRHAIVECIIAQEETTPVGLLLPGLRVISDQHIEHGLLRERSRNLMNRAGIRRWNELARLAPSDILAWRNAGILTARDILGVCVDASVEAVDGYGVPAVADPDLEATVADDACGSTPTLRPLPDDPQVAAVMQATRALRTLAWWSASEHGAERMDEALRLALQGCTPPDVNEAVNMLGALDPALLAPGLGHADSDLDPLVEELMGQLGPGMRTAFMRRVVDGDATLEEVGAEMGVTRERVRQLQAKAETQIKSLMEGDRFRPIHWRAWALASALGRAAPVDSPITQEALARAVRGSTEERRRVVESLVLSLAGQYRERDGWLVPRNVPPVDAKALASLADPHGLMSIETATEWLAQQGIRPEFHDQWLAQQGRLRREGDTLLVWSGGAVGKCVALLALHGRPMDAEALVELVGEGHAYRGVRNGFLDDARMMRVSRSLWGLRSWGMEEYTGIAEEIAQRIEVWGGQAKLQRLVDELVPLFGVRESSVRGYAQAPMFVQEDGWVRMRRADEPFEVTADVASSRGVFLHEHGLTTVFTLDGEILRGSGHSFPPAASQILGVLPGTRREFAWSGGSLLISWPASSCLGPTMGSTRSMALATGGEAGDYLRLTFDSARGTVDGTTISATSLAALRPEEAVAALSGIGAGEHPESGLAAALGVPAGSLRRVLLERGDTLLVNLLPDTETSDGLDDALGELVKLLDANG